MRLLGWSAGVIIAVSLFGPVAALGQQAVPPDCSSYKQTPGAFSLFYKYVCTTVDDVKEAKATDRTAGLRIEKSFFQILVALVAKANRPAYIVEAEESGVDQQVGAGSSSSGTTTLVSKGSVPSVLGFAVENGALDRTTSGTTITFRGNPLGIAKALASKGFIQSYEEDADDPPLRVLRKFSFALSFDTTRGNPTGATDQMNIFTGNLQQLASYSLRLELYNKRDPRNKAYQRTWEAFLAGKAEPFAKSVDLASTNLTVDRNNETQWGDPELQRWFEETNQELAKVGPDQVEAVYKQQLDQIPLSSLSENTKAELEKVERTFDRFLESRDQVLEKIAKGSILTFDFTSTRQPNAPDLWNFNLIGETGLGGKADLTGNASVTVLSKKPAGTSGDRLRDYQVSGQLDYPVGDVRGLGKFVFSVAGKFQHLMEDVISPDGAMLMDTKGDIKMLQLKLSVPVRGSGVKVPISVTFANRTDLIKEKEVRANIGFTLNLDTLFAKFKP